MTQIPFTPFGTPFNTPFPTPFGNPFAFFNPFNAFNVPFNGGINSVPGLNTPVNAFNPFNQFPGAFNAGVTNTFNATPFHGFGGFQGGTGFPWNTPFNAPFLQNIPGPFSQGFNGIPNIPFGFVPFSGLPFVGAFPQNTVNTGNTTQNTTSENGQTIPFGYAIPFSGLPFGFVGYQNGVQNGPVQVKAA